MKSTVAAIFVATLVSSLAQNSVTVRKLHRGRGAGGGRGYGGGGGRGGQGGGKGRDRVEKAFMANCYWGQDESAPLISRINEECDGYDCTGVTKCLDWESDEDDILVEGCDEDMSEEDASELKDQINTALQEKREKFKDMSEEERAAYRQEREEMRQRNAENVMNCGCCSSNSEYELGELVGHIEGAVARTLGFITPKGEGGSCVGRLQAMVEAECPGYISTCPTEPIDIGTECVLEKPERPNVDWSSLTLEEKDQFKEQMQVLRDEFKEQVLKCSCCTGISVAELLGIDETSSSEDDSSVESEVGLVTKDRPSGKINFTIPRPNRPYRPHRGRQHGQF